MVNQLLGVSCESEVNQMAGLFSDFVDGCLSVPINLTGFAYYTAMKAEHENLRRTKDEEMLSWEDYKSMPFTQCDAVAAQSSVVYELKETLSAPKTEEAKTIGRKSQTPRPLSNITITVKPHAKKARTEATVELPLDITKPSDVNVDKSSRNGTGANGCNGR